MTMIMVMMMIMMRMMTIILMLEFRKVGVQSVETIKTQAVEQLAGTEVNLEEDGKGETRDRGTADLRTRCTR